MRRYITNSPELRRRIEKIEHSKDRDERRSITEEDESYTQNTLGDNQELRSGDYLLFDVRYIADLASQSQPTKRTVVGIATRFFGIISPCTILFKLLLQRIWEAGVGWDDILFGELFTSWNQLIAQLKRASTISVPRYYFEGVRDVTSCTL